MAGDTFRAAAAEQLAGWAERSRAEMAAATSPKQRPDALMYSAIDRVRMLAGIHPKCTARHHHPTYRSKTMCDRRTVIGILARDALKAQYGLGDHI